MRGRDIGLNLRAAGDGAGPAPTFRTALFAYVSPRCDPDASSFLLRGQLPKGNAIVSIVISGSMLCASFTAPPNSCTTSASVNEARDRCVTVWFPISQPIAI